MNVERKAVFTGHFASIYCLAEKDRSVGTFFSAGGDGHIVEWNLEAPDKGRVVATVEGKIFSLHYFSNEGAEWLVAGDMNGGLHWINFAETAVQPIGRALHKKGVFDLFFLDENTLFSLGGDGYLGKWNVQNQRATESIQLSAKSLRCIDFNPALELAAIGASDGSIYLVKLPQMAVIQLITKAHEPSVFSAKWSPDGRFLLTGGRDALLKIWDAEHGFSLHQTLNAHWYTINHIAFSPTGKYFATASRDKSLKIWETENKKLNKVLSLPRFDGHVNSVNRLLWMDEKTLLSTGDDRVILQWRLRT